MLFTTALYIIVAAIFANPVNHTEEVNGINQSVVNANKALKTFRAYTFTEEVMTVAKPKSPTKAKAARTAVAKQAKAESKEVQPVKETGTSLVLKTAQSALVASKDLAKHIMPLSAFVSMTNITELVSKLTEVEAISGLFEKSAEIRRKGTLALLRQRITMCYPRLTSVESGKIGHNTIVDPRKESVALLNNVSIDDVTDAMLKKFSTTVNGWRSTYGYLTPQQIVDRIETAEANGDLKAVGHDAFKAANVVEQAIEERVQSVNAWLKVISEREGKYTKLLESVNVEVAAEYANCYTLPEGTEKLIFKVGNTDFVRFDGVTVQQVNSDKAETSTEKAEISALNLAYRVEWCLSHMNPQILHWNNSTGMPTEIPEDLLIAVEQPEEGIEGEEGEEGTTDTTEGEEGTEGTTEGTTTGTVEIDPSSVEWIAIEVDGKEGETPPNSFVKWVQTVDPSEGVADMIEDFFHRPSSLYNILAEEAVRVMADRKAKRIAVNDPVYNAPQSAVLMDVALDVKA